MTYFKSLIEALQLCLYCRNTDSCVCLTLIVMNCLLGLCCEGITVNTFPWFSHTDAVHRYTHVNNREYCCKWKERWRSTLFAATSICSGRRIENQLQFFIPYGFRDEFLSQHLNNGISDKSSNLHLDGLHTPPTALSLCKNQVIFLPNETELKHVRLNVPKTQKKHTEVHFVLKLSLA